MNGRFEFTGLDEPDYAAETPVIPEITRRYCDTSNVVEVDVIRSTENTNNTDILIDEWLSTSVPPSNFQIPTMLSVKNYVLKDGKN